MSDENKPIEITRQMILDAADEELIRFKQIEAEKLAKKQGGKKTTEPQEFQFDYRQVMRSCSRGDVGDAELLTTKFQGQYIYEEPTKTWYEFSGTHWTLDHDFKIEKCVESAAVAYEDQARYYDRIVKHKFDGTMCSPNVAMIELEKKRDAYSKRAKALRDNRKIQAVSRVCRRGDMLGGGKIDWDQHLHLFACANTVIDLRTGAKTTPDPFNFLLRSSEVEWHGLQAESELWEKFLREVTLGNRELADYMQIMAGYFLTGETGEQKFWCLHGPGGANGKGVFFRSLRRIMGGYYSTIPSELLVQQYGSQKNIDPILVELRESAWWWPLRARRGRGFPRTKSKTSQATTPSPAGRCTANRWSSTPG